MKKRLFLFTLFWTFISYSQDTLETVEEVPTSFYLLDEAQLDSTGKLAIWEIQFELAKVALRDTNDPCLLAIASYLLKHPELKVEISYHRDCRFSASSSTRLSLGRARYICTRLTELGVPADQLTAAGYDDTQPYVLNGKPLTCEYITSFSSNKERNQLHAYNRRLEIRIL